MIKSNGGIIGPDNVTTGGPFGSASGVFKLGEVTDLIKDSKWPTAGPAGFQVANSCRFATGSSDYLKRSQSGGNREKWTYSTWVKKTLKVANSILINPIGVNIAFNSTHTLYMDISGVGRMFETNAVFRDTSAWMNIVVAFNTTDYSTVSAGQVKVYVNGVEQTFTSTTNLSQGFDSGMNESGVDMAIGRDESGDNNYADYYLAETVLIDGQQLTPTSFGEFDSDSGIWKPIDVSGLTFGTNGFYLDFKDSSALGNDAAGSNNFTANNLTSLDQSIDTCTNNFATFNPLITTQSNTIPVFSEGNLTSTFDNGSTNEFALSTFAVSSGKWYAEFKWVAATGSGTTSVGIVKTDANFNQDVNDNGISYKGNGQKNIGGSSSSYGATYGTGNIISIALNMDDNQVTFYKDGASQGAISITADLTYFMYCTDYNSKSADANFGAPETSVSSGNTDGNGFGNFEYAPPSGYLALCTNNLNA